MPMYRYEATDRSGRSVVGAMDAQDEATVRARLATGGYTPTLIETSAGAPGAQSSPRVAPIGGPVLSGGKRQGVKVSTQALGRFYRQMAASARGGVPITQAMPSIRAGVRDRRLRRAVEDIEATVSAGRTVSEAMARHPEAFRMGHVGLVKAGEGAGFLDRAFEELAVQAEADWGVEAAVRFNIILFLIRWAALPFMVAWLYLMVNLMPMVRGGTAPSMHAFARIGIGFVLAGGAAALVLNGLLPVVWRVARSTALGDWFDNLTSYLPVVGARRRRTDAVKTLSALSSATNAGVPPTLCWQLASEAADTPRYRNAMLLQAPLVRQGAPLPDVLAATRLFDADTVNMIRSGEEAGNMPEMMAQAVYYQREEAKQMANLTPWVIALIAYFLLLIVGGAMFVAFASQVYGGMIQRGLDL